METIDPISGVVTNVPNDFTNFDPDEVFGSTYDPGTDTFLTTDRNGNLATVTPGGVWSFIGALPCSDRCRGIAFNGGALWVGERIGDKLFEINPANGAEISQQTVTLAGRDVRSVLGLATDPSDGTLYGIIKTGDGTGNRRLATLNTGTGVATDIGNLPRGFANIAFVSTVLPVDIDIKPGSFPNSINLCSNGAVPVAVLGSETFDVLEIDTETLRLAELTVKMVGRKDPHTLCSYQDLNDDSFTDLVCHFQMADLATLNGLSTSATVNGELDDMTSFEGTDSVIIVKDTCN